MYICTNIFNKTYNCRVNPSKFSFKNTRKENTADSSISMKKSIYIGKKDANSSNRATRWCTC